MKISTTFHSLVCLFLFSLVHSSEEEKKKILCLHGGGGNGIAFEFGMKELADELSDEFEFVYPTAPYQVGEDQFLWIRDPPEGKGKPTTDPAWADESISALDKIVTTEGPFYGILGYSQGAAFVPVYLSRAPVGTFEIAVTFCGYPTLTHKGLLKGVRDEAPFGDIPHLIWIGQNDKIISPSLTDDLVEFFTEPLLVSSRTGGHNVVDANDSTFSTVTTFIRGGSPILCEDIEDKKDCKNTQGCKWKKRKCNKDGEKPVDGCKDIKKKKDCKKTTGCKWKKRKCLDDGEKPVKDCEDIEKKNICKSTEGCKWKKRKCEGDGEKPVEDCKDIKDDEICEKTEICIWDDEKDYCYEGDEKPEEKCEDIKNENKCEKTEGCSWYEDGDKEVCYKGDEKPEEKCEDIKNEKNCEKTDGCSWYNPWKVCYDNSEKKDD